MKIYTTIKEANFTAKSKASGRVVNFASQQNRDNAIKSGEYEETDGPTADTAPAKPKVNIFDKPKPATQPTSDKDSSEPKAPLKAAPVVKTPVDVLKSKVEKWSEKEKAFFRDGIHKQDSPERRNWKDAIKDKAKGAIAAIKKGAKHEVEEFKAAGAGVKNFFSGKELSEHEKKALKAVAIKVATTAIFGAVTGGAGHGVLAFGKHVALEFIPHVVGETILKGAGTAALFAGDEEEDVYMERFMAIIADKMASEKITPELMTQMVDSYNAKKGESVNEESYKVAGRPVTLIKGKKSDATDWKVKFQNGKEASLSDVLALIKPFPKGVHWRYKNLESVNESDLKGYLVADVVDDIVKSIGSKFVSGEIKNAPNKNYIYLKLTDIKFSNDVIKMLKSKFGIDAKIDKTFGNIPSVSFASKKVVSESVNEEIRELTPDQSEMVQGIIDMLLQIDDIDNRMEVAQQQIQNFKDEEIVFNYAWFLSAAGLDNNDEPVRMDVKTQPQHIINKESIMIGKINEDFKHIIHVDTPTQVVSKPIAAQILALAKKGIRSKDIGLEMGFVGNQKLATDAFQKVKNKIYFELGKNNESVNEEDTKSPEETLASLKQMAMGDLERIEDYAEMISDRMKEGQELSAWMYSQITLAVDQLNAVHDTMDGKDGIKESVNEGKKAFKVNPGIGSSKYSISSHDGVKKHKDGSDFWDIEIFKNKVDLEKGIKKYTSNGFVKESVNEVKYPTDLKVGSVILGQGFTMLKGIEGGKYYKVVSMDDTTATLVPSDKSGNVKGSKQVRHKLDSIEGGIKTAKRGDENGIVVIKESVNEGLYFVGYNKGRGQGTGVFKDSYSSYKDAKKAVEKLEKERGGSYNMIAYYVSDKDGKFVRESVNEVITTPKKSNPSDLAKTVLGWYDFYTAYIDDGGQYRRAEKQNEDTLEWFASHPSDVKDKAYKIMLSQSKDKSKIEGTFGKHLNESTPGEQIQNLNNRLTKLRQDMAKVKSPEAKNVIQAKMKNALQKLSNKKKELSIKKP